MPMKKVDIERAMDMAKPERISLVISADAGGKPNLMPATWFMRTSGKPALFAVSLHKGRHTYSLIEARKEFVLALPGPGMEKVVSHAGKSTGRKEDKFSSLGLVSLPPSVIGVPLLDGAAANFECRVVSTHETGDHVIVVGEVVAAHTGGTPSVLIHVGNYEYRTFQI